MANTNDTECRGQCCRRMIYVTPFDVLRVKRYLAIDPLTFTLHFRESPDVPFPTFLIGDHRCQMAFSRSTSGACPFLLAVGSKFRCGIYVIRPMGCRTWPWHREDGRREKACAGCCFTGDEALERMSLEASLEQLCEEKEYYGKIVDAWNGGRLANYAYDHFIEYVLQEAERAYDYYSAWREAAWR